MPILISQATVCMFYCLRKSAGLTAHMHLLLHAFSYFSLSCYDAKLWLWTWRPAIYKKRWRNTVYLGLLQKDSTHSHRLRASFYLLVLELIQMATMHILDPWYPNHLSKILINSISLLQFVIILPTISISIQLTFYPRSTASRNKQVTRVIWSSPYPVWSNTFRLSWL